MWAWIRIPFKIGLALLMIAPVTTAQEASSEAVYRAESGYFREMALGHPGSGPAIVAVDQEDSVWVALARLGQLARYKNGTIDTFDIGLDSRPVGLAVGTPENGHPGMLWIAASFDNKLIRFEIATQEMKTFEIEGETSWPFNVAIHPSGTVWFTQRASGRLGRLDPASGDIVHFEPPTPSGGPAGLAIDQRTGEVWFTESYADRIARLDPQSGEIREYVMGDASTGKQTGPAGLAIDAEGGVWFAKLEGKLGHLASGAEEIELIDLPPHAKRPAGVTIGRGGEVWAAVLDGNQLLRYEPKERILTGFQIPTGSVDERPEVPPFARTSRPFGIAVDAQGNVWFSEQYTGQLAVLDIAAPRLEVFSPPPVVKSSDVLVTVRATDRVAGVARTELRLDGEPVETVRGRLEVLSLLPGPHELELIAVDHAGQRTSVRRAFRYAPDHLALIELLGGLEPLDGQGEESQRRLIASARQMPRADRQEKVAEIRLELVQNRAHFHQLPPTLKAMLDFQERAGGRQIAVRILDQAPFFEPPELVLRRGDTVRFTYDPASEGHSLSHELHRIEIRTEHVEVQSPLLRAGESFSYRFQRRGRFAVQDTEQPSATATVEVKG